MESSKGHRWTSQSLEAWIQRAASMNVTAKLQFPEVEHNNQKRQVECKYYHKKLQEIPIRWIETMGRMNVNVLRDFARCVARLTEMVDHDSPTRLKAASDVKAVEFLVEYYTWEYIHLDGQQVLNHPSINDPMSNRTDSRGTDGLLDPNHKKSAIYPHQIIEADAVLSGDLEEAGELKVQALLAK